MNVVNVHKRVYKRLMHNVNKYKHISDQWHNEENSKEIIVANRSMSK